LKGLRKGGRIVEVERDRKRGIAALAPKIGSKYQRKRTGRPTKKNRPAGRKKKRKSKVRPIDVHPRLAKDSIVKKRNRKSISNEYLEPRPTM